MKTPQKTILTFVLMIGALASGAAMAQHHGHGHAHGGGVRLGVYFGVPFYAPPYYTAHFHGYYPVPYYVYPAPAYTVVQSPPATYIEKGAAQAAAPAQAQPPGDWYYCADSKAYYPYVKDCPAGWQRVPAQPPSR